MFQIILLPTFPAQGDLLLANLGSFTRSSTLTDFHQTFFGSRYDVFPDQHKIGLIFCQVWKRARKLLSLLTLLFAQIGQPLPDVLSLMRASTHGHSPLHFRTYFFVDPIKRSNFRFQAIFCWMPLTCQIRKL